VIAQNLRMPRNPLAAAKLLLKAEARPVSLGRITLNPVGHRRQQSWYFFIAAGMGLHAALMNLAPTGQGKRRGGRLAYFVGGARLLIDHPVQPFAIDFTHEDGTTTTETACEAIAAHVPEINRWKTGGDPFGRGLSVAWLPPTGRVGLAHASFHALTTDNGHGSNGHTGNGAHKVGWGNLPYAHYVTVTKMICRPLNGQTSETPLLVEADGEVLGANWTAISMAETRLQLLWPNGK
jgi:diacylglycerol kinase (ATP)